MNGEITYTSIVFIWGFVTEIVAFIEFERKVECGGKKGRDLSWTRGEHETDRDYLT